MSHSNKEQSNPSNSSASEMDSRKNQSNGGELVPFPAFREMGPRIPVGLTYPAADSSIDRKALLNALRRRWFLALSLGLIFGTAGAFGAWFLVPAPYTAYTELLIKSVPERVLFETAQPLSKFEIYKSTHMRRAKSPYVLAAALVDPKLQGLKLIKEQPRPREWLEEELKVESPAEEFIRISLSSDMADGLAEIVNAVTNTYFDEVVNVENKEKSNRLNELKDVLIEQNNKLRVRRNFLKRQIKDSHTSDPATLNLKQQMELEYFGELRKLLVQVRFDLRMAKSQLSVIDNELTEGVLKLQERLVDAQIEMHPDLIKANKEIERAEAFLTHYEGRVEADNPRLVQLKKDVEDQKDDLEKLRIKSRTVILEDLKIQVDTNVETSEIVLRERIRTLEIEQKKLEVELEGQSERDKATGELSLELEFLRKDIAQDEEIIRQITDEVNRLEIELRADVRIIRLIEAKRPTEPNVREKYIATACSGFGMFALFFVGVVWLEFRTRRIGGMEEVTSELNLRVMGSLPNVPRSAINGSSRRSRSRNAYWKNIVTESIDSARTMLLQEADSHGVNLVMVTSAMASEGKTTLSCHLASSLVRAGKKVLLIDGDLRWPGIHAVYEKPLFPGLGELLNGDVDFDEVIHETSQDGLWVLPAGKHDESVHQCLAQGMIDSIFHQAKQDFEFVIVDSSPVLPVSDSLMMAQHCDAVLFSIRRDVSQVMKVAAATERLDRLRVPVLGAVVIGLENNFYGVSHRDYSRYASV